jgi:hypothetical protein
MPGQLLHVGSGVKCTHGGTDTAQTSNIRVKVTGMNVLTSADVYPVAGCPFQVPVPGGTKPQPCVRIQWAAPASRVKINGIPAILATSGGSGISAEGAPQGPPVVAGFQIRVVAT